MTWVVEFSMNYERKHAKRDGALLVEWEYPKVCVNLQTDVR